VETTPEQVIEEALLREDHKHADPAPEDENE
jgi:hypothetical protein